MTEQNIQKAMEALSQIEEALENVKEYFPEIKSPVKINTALAQTNPFKLLKRVNGIITGFNEENAERKLNNLTAFLAIKKK